MELHIGFLKTFVTVAETRNFTRAAQMVNKTQSAVSMQIKAMEKDLGQSLFHRQGKNVSLTMAGQELMHYALEIIRLNNKAVASISGVSLPGKLSVGSTEDYTGSLLPRVLAGFSDNYPEVMIDLCCMNTPRLMRAVANKELDLALCTQEAGGRGDAVFKEPLVWAASSRFCWNNGTPLPLAVFNPGCVYRESALRVLGESAQDYRISCQSPNLSGVLAAVRSGIAVAPMARSTLGPDMVVLGPERGLPELPVMTTVVAKGEKVGSSLAQEFVNLVRSLFVES